ncbi:DNA primase/polymerase [Streptomyces phage Psst2]|nr:DNA primase/polymerase [Streptomyces phage Psst2]
MESKLDFFQVSTKPPRKAGDPVEVYPDFIVGNSKDLMVRGQSFYAMWNEKLGMWSTREYDVKDAVDEATMAYADKLVEEGTPCKVQLLRSHKSKGWSEFKQYLKNASDDVKQLDTKLTFLNTDVKKTDYVSKRLPYNLAPGDCSAWCELMSTLYSPEEREKIEWAIGAIVSGDSKKIEKFLVFFGEGGTGKSTVMKIIEKLFEGYVGMFEAKSLVSSNNAFATAVFKTNPLVAIQHDGDLSKIEDNSLLNSVVGHDKMIINEKHKPGYEMVINAFLFMGTNKPVKITDSKSGLIRRLIDVNPTGVTFEYEHYLNLMNRIEFELGAIAHHCLEVYKAKGGKGAYNGYRPERMILNTDPFANFIDDHFEIFKEKDGTTLTQAWALYNAWAEDSKLGYSMKKYHFREHLKDYFNEFHDRATFDKSVARSVYKGFRAKKYRTQVSESKPEVFTLALEETESILDEMYAGYPAQYANAAGTPKLYWDKSERIHKKTGEPFIPEDDQVVSTVLGDLDTSELHYVKLPEYHIWIDFDLTEDDGKTKSLQRSMEAAAAWPHTYAEISKGGSGVHLHYIYDGDTSKLAAEYEPGIEIKVCRGNTSLRRKLTKCNNVAVATLNGGLPLKKEKDMLTDNTIKTEQGIRNMIVRCLRKEFGSTKQNVDFIAHILREAKRKGIVFDVTDMRSDIMALANNSTNQKDICLKTVFRMDFQSEASVEDEMSIVKTESAEKGRIVFFDCEVYPNLFVVSWKYLGSPTVTSMIEPTPTEVEDLVKNFKLVGFNNRGYDNHILWGRMMGMNNEELYRLSQRIIVENDNNAKFPSAWNASYADVYDFSSDKKSLKKWEIELGITHMEMDIPWDKPVPKNKIKKVVEYCENDVRALEAVWNHCHQDFIARQILADLSGLTVNHSTRTHVMRILFGGERNPQRAFVYTDLSEMFPGYKFDEYAKVDKSTYRGEVVGEGGYVYAEPGMYENVALLDVASMHPTSIVELNLFGKYTAKYSAILEARLSIKEGDYEYAKGLLEGKLAPHIQEIERIEDPKERKKAFKNLEQSLKLVANSTYGYTSAKFDNPARDPRNKDNIVAKRGALYMIDLKHALQEKGVTVAHIKTDSVKIPNATPEIIQFVKEHGAKYGYEFKHEVTYKKMCLVNDAVYIAYVGWAPKGDPVNYWTATGAEFKHPYVFKTLFTGDPIYFKDLCETKQVKEGAMYLRFNGAVKEIGEPKDEALTEETPGDEDTHVGRSGMFVPINPHQDIVKGGELLRIKDGKEFAVSGTKGYSWLEAEAIRLLYPEAVDRMVFENMGDAVEGTGSIADIIDVAYYNQVAEDAYQSIAEYGNVEEFLKV